MATRTKAGKNESGALRRARAGAINSGSPSKQDFLDALDGGPAAGTTARVTSAAIIQVGRNIQIHANEDAELNSLIGGFAAGGFAGVGASVGVYRTANNATASSSGVLESTGGQISISSNLDQDTEVVSLAGATGLAALGASVVDIRDASTVQASTGGRARRNLG